MWNGHLTQLTAEESLMRQYFLFADDSTAMVDGQNKTFNGYLVGDVTGSVFADDSSPIVDAVGRDIFANDLETFRVTNRTGTLTQYDI